MDSNSKKDVKDKLETSQTRKGLGYNAFWNGPFNTAGDPKGKGSSSGKDGIVLNNAKPEYNNTPLAKRKG